MTKAYEMALEEMREAGKVYEGFRVAYRSMQIGDAEFLAAQAIHSVAVAKFDVAFEIEAATPEVEEVIEVLDNQLTMF